MTREQAEQIAALVSMRNQLATAQNADTVLRAAGNYLVELEGDTVIACVEVKKVQWYQWEIRHLSVREEREGQGFGKRLIRRAEEKASDGTARIVQCTIRVGNVGSEQAFRRSGYRETCCFFNAATRNYVAVWQKVLSHDQYPRQQGQ